MTEKYACTAERFAEDTKGHVLTVERDEGLQRHLQFKRPGDRAYWFDIVTWPGVLVLHGDMGTYVFSRIADMFDFFRRDGDGRINPSYWAEKLQGQFRTKADRGMEFSQELFRQAVKTDFRQRWRGRCNTADDFEQRRECWESVQNEVLGAACDGEDAAIRAAIAFTFPLPRNSALFSGDKFEFVDFYEHNFYEYRFDFIWCLRAIVWGIEQYDVSKAAKELAHA
jgi:hypothetical protein